MFQIIFQIAKRINIKRYHSIRTSLIIKIVFDCVIYSFYLSIYLSIYLTIHVSRVSIYTLSVSPMFCFQVLLFHFFILFFLHQMTNS